MDAQIALSYEEAFEKLEQALAALQNRHLDLEDALKQYEEGTKLALYCRDLLQKAELRVQQLHLADDGNIGSEPLDLA